jgi:sphingomyelin phosphodiesterase acid-like 3
VGKDSLAAHQTGSISPIFGNNPAFQVYRFDESSGAVTTHHTCYLANLATAGRPTRLEDLHWLAEYEFRSAYRQERLDLSAVTSIARDLQKKHLDKESLYALLLSACSAHVR